MLKGAAGAETEFIVRLKPPILVMVMFRLDVAPTTILPKFNADGDTLILDTAEPVPERVTVSAGVSGSFELITNVDCLNPELVGLKVIVRVQVPAAFRLPMQLPPVKLKSPDGLVMLIIFNATEPLFVTVTF